MKVEEEEADESLPEFFKVYITLHSSRRMLMPREFVVYLEGKKSGHATLAGPSGKTWGVELVEEGEDVYFTDGWQAFVNDNMVRDGEFLFFQLHGNLVFSVTIYDESMCEKVRLSADQFTEGADDVKEAGQEEDVAEHGKKRSVKDSLPKGLVFHSKVEAEEGTPTSVNPSFEKCISISSLKDACYFAVPTSFIREHSLSYKDYEKMVLQTPRNSTWEVSVINSFNTIILRKGWPAFARENNIKVGDVCKFELLDRLKMLVHVKRRQEGTNKEKQYVVAASRERSAKKAVAVSQHSLKRGEQKPVAKTMPSLVNPSFVTEIRKYNVEGTLLANIPSWFLHENSLNYKRGEKMVLRTIADSTWVVKINHTKTACHLSGGWAAFARDNNIEEGDTCEFELLKRLEMKVHITHRSSLDVKAEG